MNRIYLTKSSLLPSSGFIGILFLSGLFFSDKPMRQYSPENTVKKQSFTGTQETREQYFFNARKTPGTNTIDYGAMLKCQQIIESDEKFHRALSAMGLYWNPLGPDNVGGETRAVLIDKNDPTGQTLFAGGVAGGLWKSVNGGVSWSPTAIGMSNDCISCITQDSSGTIFAGTGLGFALYSQGLGFSTGMLGAGIYKSVDDGATFNVLPATVPSVPNNDAILWAYTDRIAIISGNPDIIYAGTSVGLMVSTDGGNTFNYATTNGTTKLTGNALDVAASSDGKLVVACVNGNAYYAYPLTSISDFTLIHQHGTDSLPSSVNGRIELAIAPGNSNYVYASVVGYNDNFIGIYMTMNALSSGNGGNWYDIGPGGSKSFNPYENEGTYNNAIGVFPNNPGKAIFGGFVLWEWVQSSAADTVGAWSSISTASLSSVGNSNYVHADDMAIVIDSNNPNKVYICTDGGVYKSTDAAKTFQPANRGCDVTQFYSIAFPPYTTNGEGVIGGSQDNGTIYISGTNYYPEDGNGISTADGAQCAISSLNGNICYVTETNGFLLRANNLNGFATLLDAYTKTGGLNTGANIDSVSHLQSGSFITPLALYENPYDTITLDSITWIANKTYNAGDTIYPVSPNGNIEFPYILNKAVAQNAVIKVQNRVVSKIATGFSATNGVWMMMQAADFNNPMVWMPIGGPLSLPDAFKGNDPVHCMAWSPDGDALFVGTEGGQLFRFSNLDSIIDTSYITGGLFSMPTGGHAVTNSLTRVKSKNLTAASTIPAATDILSISIDPHNGNRILVTTGSYVGGTHVYYCGNALSFSPSFFTRQGNLPEMPVYGSVIDIVNSPYPNGALVATEHGVYSTPDVTVASPVWSADNNSMDNTITLAIKQQTLPPWNCNNSGKIYIATGGRGLYVDSTFFVPVGINQLTDNAGLKGSMRIYPNPMKAGGIIAFTIPESEKVTITIYDMQGRVVEEIPVTDRTPGNHTISINTSDMAIGTYIATATGSNFKCSGRFVVVR